MQKTTYFSPHQQASGTVLSEYWTTLLTTISGAIILFLFYIITFQYCGSSHLKNLKCSIPEPETTPWHYAATTLLLQVVQFPQLLKGSSFIGVIFSSFTKIKCGRQQIQLPGVKSGAGASFLVSILSVCVDVKLDAL